MKMNPLLMYAAMLSGGAPSRRPPPDPEERRHAMAERMVWRLHCYWVDENRRQYGSNRRNRPCACASGQKVKHCHG